MGVSGIPLGVGGREDGGDKGEGPDDLSSSQASALAVAVSQLIGTATVAGVVGLLERLHKHASTDGPRTLSHHVDHGPDQGYLPSQEQPKCHSWIYVPSCA